jgi:eukaryotic-like serine/threonine-protein kinase
VSQTARRCRNCGQLNYGKALFCQSCGEDISAVEAVFIPWSQHQQLPPVAAAVREDGRRFARFDSEAAGSGLVWTGLAIVAAGLLIDLSSRVLAVLVIAGVVVMVAGLWQLRTDFGGLSRLGVWLVAVSALSLAVVAWRVLEPDPPNPVNLIQPNPTQTPAVAAILVGEGSVPMHRGGAAHLGVNPGPAPKGTLFRSWRFDTGGELYSSPAVSGDWLVVGSKSGFLYGLNATTGEQVWSRDLGQYIVRSTPAILEDIVYVNNGYQSLALSLDDGSTLWTVDVSFTGNTSPTVENKTVYVASQNGAILALDARTGEQRWRMQLEGLIFGSPTADDGRLLVATDGGKVFALNLETGLILWRFQADGGIFAPVISDEGVVYFTTNAGATYAITATEGEQQWRYDAGGASGGSVTLNEVIVGSDNGGVSAIDRETGSIIWLAPTGGQIMVGPTIVGKLVVVASGQTLYGFDIDTGEQRFTYATGYTIQIAPAVVNGTIYVGGRDGFLDAIVGDAPNANAPA